ncbi:MAG: SpoVA/SpoVAEb family sporulation membrane protein [Eubacteriales bacterium]|nr:SpoVA/SpoVAEb family sporulation membrane protein [Eubacteriales bacterium]MDD4422152.1 SpoVA/SpoVAEb family sporulation membrane protein [Eubacteriales bacterium]HBR31269.1 stage V sporulation protein AD [Clostridiales bacterium]
MHMNKKEYIEYAGNRAKKSNSVVNCIKAFIFGGFICCLGQGFRDLYVFLGEEELVASTLSSVTLIFLAGLFTGIGWFDKIAKHAGAGTLVPITGFSNAVTAPAIDAKSEGFITGVASQMFVIAGPVIVYGTVASIIYGIIYFFIYRSGGI